MSSWLVNVRFP